MPDISEIKLYARKNDVPIMQDQSQQFICEYIKNHNYKKILEIGTAIGYSTIQFAKTSPDVKVTSIELDIDRFIKARNLFNCLENADAEAGQDLPDLPVGIGAVAGYDQRSEAVNHQPEVAEIAIRLLFADIINIY